MMPTTDERFTWNMNAALLQLFAAIVDVGCALGDEQRAQLAELAQLQVARAPMAGLSRYRTSEDVVDRAIRPVVAILRLAPQGRRWAEVGAGSGALGSALAIVQPDIELMLIDRRNRSVLFIDMLIRRLGLSNCRALQADLPADAGLLEDPCDVVVARAVATLPRTLQLCRSIVAPGGSVIMLHRAQEGDLSALSADVMPCQSVQTNVEGLVASAFRASD